MSHVGHYVFSYAGGSFPVALRPSGVFYCPQFPAQAKYVVVDGSNLQIDWANFGKYTLQLEGGGGGGGDAPSWSGSKVDDASSWRKMTYSGPFSAEEALLMGNGGGSMWGFQWEKGEFEIELCCDGFNHFVCKDFPAHSHWQSSTSADGKCRIDINWGKYGEYEMVLDAATRSMVGHKKGQPANWRKAYMKKPLGTEVLSAVPAHDHSHKHEHGESCSGNHH